MEKKNILRSTNGSRITSFGEQPGPDLLNADGNAATHTTIIVAKLSEADLAGREAIKSSCVDFYAVGADSKKIDSLGAVFSFEDQMGNTKVVVLPENGKLFTNGNGVEVGPNSRINYAMNHYSVPSSDFKYGMRQVVVAFPQIVDWSQVEKIVINDIPFERSECKNPQIISETQQRNLEPGDIVFEDPDVVKILLGNAYFRLEMRSKDEAESVVQKLQDHVKTNAVSVYILPNGGAMESFNKVAAMLNKYGFMQQAKSARTYT